MPQLDISTYASQIFWLIFFFGILYLFILRVFLPRINQIIKNRGSLLSSMEVDINHMKIEIEEKRVKNSRIIDDAKSTAQSILNEAGNILAKMKTDTLKEFLHKSNNIYDQNKIFLRKFKLKSKNELKRMTFEITLKYCSNIFQDDLNQKVIDFSIVREFITKEIERDEMMYHN